MYYGQKSSDIVLKEGYFISDGKYKIKKLNRSIIIILLAIEFISLLKNIDLKNV